MCIINARAVSETDTRMHAECARAYLRRAIGEFLFARDLLSTGDRAWGPMRGEFRAMRARTHASVTQLAFRLVGLRALAVCNFAQGAVSFISRENHVGCEQLCRPSATTATTTTSHPKCSSATDPSNRQRNTPRSANECTASQSTSPSLNSRLFPKRHRLCVVSCSLFRPNISPPLYCVSSNWNYISGPWRTFPLQHGGLNVSYPTSTSYQRNSSQFSFVCSTW